MRIKNLNIFLKATFNLKMLMQNSEFKKMGIDF